MAESAKEALLDVRDMSVTYKVRGQMVKAVRDVSFSVRAAEIVGVVGESGSGKSSVGRAVAGFEVPASGDIELGQFESARLHRRRRTAGRPGVQMIFQDSSLALNPRYPAWKSVAEALADGRGIRRQLRGRAVDYLRAVGLIEPQFDSIPKALSGGQRQRVAVARALASGALLIVCDEATSALDVSVRAKTLNLIRRLRDEDGIAFLIISHDIAVVANLADRVLVMHDGHIVEEGETAQVLRKPADVYTRSLIEAVPVLERRSRLVKAHGDGRSAQLPDERR